MLLMIEFENMILDLGNITTVQRVISRSRSYQRCAHGVKRLLCYIYICYEISVYEFCFRQGNIICYLARIDVLFSAILVLYLPC